MKTEAEYILQNQNFQISVIQEMFDKLCDTFYNEYSWLLFTVTNI